LPRPVSMNCVAPIFLRGWPTLEPGSGDPPNAEELNNNKSDKARGESTIFSGIFLVV
jgi:hypothetical protein